MHNNIMAAGLRDRLLMLATGRYAQWRSRFLRYIDTRPNGDALRKCILEGPYTPSTVIILVVPAMDNSLAVPERTTIETVLNMSPENKAHFESEKEAIHLILTGIGDEIYSTVDACKTAHEMWEAIERLQQEWSRFVTIIKKQHKLDEVSYHKLFDILKKYQKEVNELRAERIAKNANPLAFVATAQSYQDPYYQTPKSYKSYAPTSKALLPTRSHATTRNKGKDIAKPITPPSESASEEDRGSYRDSGTDSEPLEQVQYDAGYNVFANEIQHFEQFESIINTRVVETGNSNVIPDSLDMCDNDIQNDQNVVECDDERVTLANLIANLKLDVDENKKIQKQLKKANASLTQELNECKSILAETSRTLGESHSIWDSCLVALQNKQTEFERYKNLNDRTVDYEKLENKLNETLGLLAQKDIDIKEGLKLKAYEISVVKEKHDELVKQSLLTKSHYEGLVKEKTKVITDLKLKEEKDIDKMISMEKQLKELVDQAWVKHSKDHFRAPNAHDMEILKKKCLRPLALKTQNDSFVFVHKLKQEMHVDLKYIESLEKEIDDLEYNKAEFSNIYDMLLQECVSNDVMCSYLHSLSNFDAHTELQCLYLHKVKECDCLAQKLLKQTEFVSKEDSKTISLGKPAPFSDSLKRKHFSKTKSVPKTNVSEGLSKTVTVQNLPQIASQAVRNINVIKPGMYQIDTRTTQTRAPQLPQTSRNANPRVSTSTGVNHKTIVSRPQLKSNKMKEKVVPNTSQVKFKKTEVEDHHRISSISNQSKSVTACNDSLKSRTSNVNVVCATCGKCVFNLNHDACISKYLNDMNARTKKPKVVPISTRKPKSQANKFVATPRKKTVASESIVQNSKSYYMMLYEKTSKACKWWIEQQ
ncbi:hypothetical protein Tco_0993084 [Tanacetum coccineum]|uniref:Uncharacterized protein n=1 Tax=Tanacetum coccineum TaxID=301880 RepID=A0ABQ5F453_9ASTR